MSQWNLFPLQEARDAEMKQFVPSEREELQIIIAGQVAGLLSNFGTLEIIEITNVVHEVSDPNTDQTEYIDEGQSFCGIELPEIELDDGGLLIISQFPFQFGEYFTHAGAHSVTKVVEAGKQTFNCVVWDPLIDSDHRIYDSEGESIRLTDLQELYEALVFCTRRIASSRAPNRLSLKTAEHPFADIELEFLDLTEQFEM